MFIFMGCAWQPSPKKTGLGIFFLAFVNNISTYCMPATRQRIFFNKASKPPCVPVFKKRRNSLGQEFDSSMKETIMQFSKTVPGNILDAAKIIAQAIRRKAPKRLDKPGTAGLVKAATMSNGELQANLTEGENHDRFRHCAKAAGSAPEYGY
jgi:hypothetical protein